jgi:hypothetical protein
MRERVSCSSTRFRLREQILILERVCPLLLAQRLVVFIEVLLALGHPTQALQDQIAVVERCEKIALMNKIAGPRGRLTEEAIERRDDSPADLAFDLAGGRDPIFAGGEIEEQHQGKHR